MFVLNLGKPEDKSGVYEYTDIPLQLNLKKYACRFQEWNHDMRYIYSHDRLKEVITSLNELLLSHVPKYHCFFIITVSYAIISLMYLGLILFIFIIPSLNFAFVCALTLLLALLHGLICKFLQYHTMKNVIKSIDNRIIYLNKQFKDEIVSFKFINSNDENGALINFLQNYTGNINYSLRIIYMYMKLV